MRFLVGEWVVFIGDPPEPLLRAIHEHAGVAKVVGLTDDGRYVLDICTRAGEAAFRGIVVAEDFLAPCTAPIWAQ